MSTPFLFIHSPGGGTDPQFDRHNRKKGKTSYFLHEKDDLKVCVELL
jgi:hypothetical protein